MFENKVSRMIFVTKRDEITGGWRKLHNVQLHALSSSPDIIKLTIWLLRNPEVHYRPYISSPDIIRNIKFRRLRWVGHVARMEESRNALKF